MLDTFQVYEEFRKVCEDPLAKTLTNQLSRIYREIADTVTREDFNELKKVVEGLAKAQAKTEERLDDLTKIVGKLVQRVDKLSERLEELARAQAKTEERLDKLSQRVEELARAQAKTEKRLEELAKAQAETEKIVQKLVKDMDMVKSRLEGLSDAVGYGLEDKLIPHMNKFVKHYYGCEVRVIDRRNIIYSEGGFDEINIYIEAKKNNEDYLIIGECKSKPGKKDIDKFLQLKKRVERYFPDKKIKSFIVGYTFHPNVEEYLKGKKEVDYFKSFEIEMIASSEL